MKVKKKKEHWFAVRWEGGLKLPYELIDFFGDHVEIQDWADYSLDISVYSSKDGWQTTNVAKGMWVVFSNRKKIKVMDNWDFEERWEEDA